MWVDNCFIQFAQTVMPMLSEQSLTKDFQSLHKKRYPMFSQSVIEKILSYVYFLVDPRNNEVFYVGKGKGNRVFQHAEDALVSEADSDKLEKIREIRAAGMPVQHFILRHGLEDKESLLIEASLIDFIGKGNLTNKQSGHHSDFGLKSTNEIVAMYDAKPLETDLPLLLININKQFFSSMSSAQIYEATRSSWVLGERRNKAKYVVATFRGLTRVVYEVDNWYPVQEPNKVRWAFNGELASEEIQKELIYKVVDDSNKRGRANPVRYLNC